MNKYERLADCWQAITQMHDYLATNDLDYGLAEMCWYYCQTIEPYAQSLLTDPDEWQQFQTIMDHLNSIRDVVRPLLDKPDGYPVPPRC